MRRVVSWWQHCRKKPPRYHSSGRCRCGRGGCMRALLWALGGCRPWWSHFWGTVSTVHLSLRKNPSLHGVCLLWPNPLARRFCLSPPPPSNDGHVWRPLNPSRNNRSGSASGSFHLDSRWAAPCLPRKSLKFSQQGGLSGDAPFQGQKSTWICLYMQISYSELIYIRLISNL